MKTSITEIKNDGESIKLNDETQWYVEYYDREKVISWGIKAEVKVINEDNLFWPNLIINPANKEKIKVRRYQSNDLVPKDKYDMDTVEKIRKADVAELLPILPELFEWIEDINWPISEKLALALIKLENHLIPFVRYYLNHANGVDEYSVFHLIIPRLSVHQLKLIEEDLKRLAFKPTDFEKDEKHDKLAVEYLSKINHD